MGVLILSSILLTSCGEKAADTVSNFGSLQNSSKKSVNYEEAGYSDDTYNEYYSDNYDSDNYGDVVEAAESNGSELPDKSTGNTAISKEMLVYKCSMNIDVLDYTKSIKDYKELINKYNGFVESENYNDGGSNSKWIYENDNRFSSYRATVRIPSKDYENFCSDLEQIGDLRSKSATVDNLSQEYSDLNTTLSVYEAKEKRYIDLLSTIKEDQYAIEVERELTNIQTQIAKIKTRMNAIKEDVAYSYVDVTISEVKEYTEHVTPPKTKTFGDRLKNTVVNTFYGFMNFLENLLFFIIEILPYVLVFGILFIIVKKIFKALKNKAKAKKEKKAAEKNRKEIKAPDGTLTKDDISSDPADINKKGSTENKE